MANAKKVTTLPTNYHSNDEVDFSYYLDELKKEKYIDNWYKIIEPINVTPDYKISKNSKTHTVLNKLDYTPDFYIKWNKKAHNVFYYNQSDIASYKLKKELPYFFVYKNNESIIEIKPAFDYQNMTRTVTILIKSLFYIKDVYVQIVKLNDLYQKTFQPNTSSFKPKNKLKKVIFCKSLSEYVKNKS